MHIFSNFIKIVFLFVFIKTKQEVTIFIIHFEMDRSESFSPSFMQTSVLFVLKEFIHNWVRTS
jgi:hypothetical protein